MSEELYNAIWSYVNNHKEEFKRIDAPNRTALIFDRFCDDNPRWKRYLPKSDDAVSMAEVFQCIEDAIQFDCYLELASR